MANNIVPAVVLPLTKGHVTIVDPDVAEWASCYSWSASSKPGGRFYARGFFRGKNTLLHRAIAEATEGTTVDHINGDTLDNRRENLRLCSAEVNTVEGFNRRRYKGDIAGVGYKADQGKWRGRYTLRGMRYNVGVHDTREQAQEAYYKMVEALSAEAAEFPPTPLTERLRALNSLVGPEAFSAMKIRRNDALLGEYQKTAYYFFDGHFDLRKFEAMMKSLKCLGLRRDRVYVIAAGMEKYQSQMVTFVRVCDL